MVSHVQNPGDSTPVTSSDAENAGDQKPWLIAVTGKRGSGKTHLLAGLMDYLRREGRLFDGVLTVAGGRDNPGAGAQKYFLRWPLDNREMLLCERTGIGKPPYRFNDEAWAETGKWIRSVEANPEKPEVIILDELGRLEANGQGFAVYWNRILALNPVMMVVAIRMETREDLEHQLGQKFDLIIEAGEYNALERLCSLCNTAKDWQRVGRYGAAAGAIEVSLGSIVNATKIPFRGLVMSVIQAMVLFFAGSRLARPWMIIWVSYVAAALKALSPAGNRIRPMVAIAVQGSLFGISVRMLGWNAAGITVGAWFVGAWSGLQGFIFQYLLLGNALIDAYGELQMWLSANLGINIVSLPLLVTVYVFLTGSFSALAIGYFQWRKRPPVLLEKALRNKKKANATADWQNKKLWNRLWCEYRQKAFWIPLLIVIIMLSLSGTSTAELAGLPLRAAGIIAAIFVVFSVLKPDRWIVRLRRMGFWGGAVVLERALVQHRYDKPGPF